MDSNTATVLIKDKLSHRNEKYRLDENIENLDLDIIDQLLLNNPQLTIEFIFETLSHLGFSPSLLYDDDGHWCVTGDGIQSMNHITEEENEDDSDFNIISFGFFEKSTDFSNTIREAIVKYLQEL